MGNQQSYRNHTYEYPGSRSGGATWVDSENNLWIFGGEGHDKNPTENSHYLNDLWKFESQTLRWHLITQSNGSQSHFPKSRKYACACGVEGIAFVVFGGEKEDGEVLDDTWVFDIKHSHWLSIKNQLHPTSRSQAVSWCVEQDFIIFGGYDKITKNDVFHSDIWLFSMKSLTWKYIHSKNENSKHSSAKDIPSGRTSSLTWRFGNNTLYMFGGTILNVAKPKSKKKIVSELWMLSIPKFKWTLLHGKNTMNHIGHYSAAGFTNAKNIPGSREQAAGWIDQQGNLWMFGGKGIESENDATIVMKTDIKFLSDVWMFDISEQCWIYVMGPPNTVAHPVYGTRGHHSDLAFPGARAEAVAWSNGRVAYIFGGHGYDGRHKVSYLNDLWELRNYGENLITEVQWFRSLKPNIIFLVCLCSFGGIVLALGIGFFLKKYHDLPNNRKSQYMYNVRYSPLKEEAHFET